jgi:uncharacterized protein (DUF433 family)
MDARDRSDSTVSLPLGPPTAVPASWIEKTPGVCGGEACTRRTRVTVWGLVERRNLGLSDAEILDRLPGVTQADLDVAWEYYEQHCQEIDR